jgi:hypothetical protein
LYLPDVTDTPYLACPTEAMHRRKVEAKSMISSFSPAAISFYFFLTNSTPSLKAISLQTIPKPQKMPLIGLKTPIIRILR